MTRPPIDARTYGTCRFSDALPGQRCFTVDNQGDGLGGIELETVVHLGRPRGGFVPKDLPPEPWRPLFPWERA